MSPAADALTKLAAARYHLLQRWPDFDGIHALPLHAHPGLGTMGLTDRGTILYDPAVIAQQTVPQVAADLLHEFSHFLGQHAERCGARDRHRWNLAGDAEINGKLAACGADLSFVEFIQAEHLNGQQRGLTAEIYYDAMPAQKPARGRPCGGGSGAGQPIPGEPAEGPCADNPTLAEVIRQRTAEAIARNPSRYGGQWARWAEEQLRPPTIPWQAKLGAGLRGAFAARPGASSRTYAVASRKQAGVGRAGAGVPVLRGRGSTLPEVAIVVDTSGSIGSAELDAALAEAQGVIQAAGGRVRYLSADATVQGEAEVRTIHAARAATRGGGGTDFRPAFDHFAAAKIRPEVVIYATDGWGDAPTCAPTWCRTIWLLIGENTRRPCSWGTVITVEGA